MVRFAWMQLGSREEFGAFGSGARSLLTLFPLPSTAFLLKVNPRSPNPWLLAVLYGSPQERLRDELWTELRGCVLSMLPMICLGASLGISIPSCMLMKNLVALSLIGELVRNLVTVFLIAALRILDIMVLSSLGRVGNSGNGWIVLWVILNGKRLFLLVQLLISLYPPRTTTEFGLNLGMLLTSRMISISNSLALGWIMIIFMFKSKMLGAIQILGRIISLVSKPPFMARIGRFMATYSKRKSVLLPGWRVLIGNLWRAQTKGWCI